MQPSCLLSRYLLLVDSMDPDMPPLAHVSLEHELHSESNAGEVQLFVDYVGEILEVNDSYFLENLLFHSIFCCVFLLVSWIYIHEPNPEYIRLIVYIHTFEFYMYTYTLKKETQA